jgi:tetratricopeptide (TPR) repeat protein
VALLDEAARAIAKRLHSVAPSAATVRYVNPAAHDAYLRGRYLWFTRPEDSAAYFRKATEIEPGYAAAWAGLANYNGLEIVRGNLDPRTSMAPEEEAAERAMQLDENLAEAHQAMGAALFIDRSDWAGADREFLRAISLDPRDAELFYYAPICCRRSTASRNRLTWKRRRWNWTRFRGLLAWHGSTWALASMTRRSRI